MDPMDYAARAAGAWLLGFAPFAEIYVAVPVALATWLDPALVVAWTVAGKDAPVPLVHLLEASTALTRLATTPLLRATNCALHLDRHMSLPQQPRDLHEACIEMLLARRDTEREILEPEGGRLDYSKRRTLLGRLRVLGGRSAQIFGRAKRFVARSDRYLASASVELEFLTNRYGDDRR